jgi:hypothetical protein
MIRISHLMFAAIFAAFLAVIGMAPAAQAASFPTSSTTQVEQLGKAQSEAVRYYGRRRGYRGGYGYRRAYYRPRPVYRRAYYRPAYYGRRCWTRPRLVWTPYGYVRRYVRVCR